MKWKGVVDRFKQVESKYSLSMDQIFQKQRFDQKTNHYWSAEFKQTSNSKRSLTLQPVTFSHNCSLPGRALQKLMVQRYGQILKYWAQMSSIFIKYFLTQLYSVAKSTWSNFFWHQPYTWAPKNEFSNYLNIPYIIFKVRRCISWKSAKLSQ